MSDISIVRKDLTDNIIVEYRTKLITHLYFIFLGIQKRDQQSRTLGEKTCIING